jgi:protoheme IX farnesyltransferase
MSGSRRHPDVLVFTLLALGLSQFALGGLVQARPGGVVCGDWPLCYGRLLPIPGEEMFYEMGHRLVAGILLAGSALLAVLFSGSGRRAWMPLFWVITQALLGWATFERGLPTVVSVLHLALVPIYLHALVELRFAVRPASTVPLPRHLKDALLLLLIVFGVQLLLGGVAQKTGASSALLSGPGRTLLQIHLGVALVGVALTWAVSAWFARWRPALAAAIAVMATLQLVGGGFWRSGTLGNVIHLAGAGLLLALLVWSWVETRTREASPVPGALGDLLLLTKARLGSLVMATVLVGMLLAPFQLLFLSAVTVFLGIAFQAMGACALNCHLEREVDGLMERTRVRPLPAGRMRPLTALLIGWGLVAAGTLMILWASNALTAILGIATILIYLFVYTPLKQISPWALVVGAVPGALPPLMGWTAVTGEVSGIGLYLFCFLFVWQLPHFLAIAVYRQQDYSNAQILTFFLERGAAFTKRWIFLLTALLGALGFWSYSFDDASTAYRVTTLVLGGVLFGLSLQGMLMRDEGEAFRRWARIYFLGTVFYLPLQLATLFLLR